MSALHLSPDEKRLLLRLARATLNGWAGLPAERVHPTPRLSTERRGAFVSLRLDGDLRGCIGYVEPLATIAEAIRDLAVKAASEDPRFDPVNVQELGVLTIEVSLLTPLEPLPSLDAIVIGRHGLVVESGWKRGLLLPEVAVEYGWTTAEFVAHCCLKAGLGKDAWRRSGTRIFWFESEHFAEHDADVSDR